MTVEMLLGLIERIEARLRRVPYEVKRTEQPSLDMSQMQIERHRARRYSFHASIELTDLQSETQTKEQTSDLSLFGCHVDTLKPLPPGTKVRTKISYRSEPHDQ